MQILTGNQIAKLEEEVKKHLKDGDQLYSCGATVQQKQLGLKEIEKGLEKMTKWIASLESRYDKDQYYISVLSNQYRIRQQDTMEKWKYLQDYQSNRSVNDLPTFSVIQYPNQPALQESLIQDEEVKIFKKIKCIQWSEIEGLDEAKMQLREQAVITIKFSQYFVGARAPMKNILLYGVSISNYIAYSCWQIDDSLSLCYRVRKQSLSCHSIRFDFQIRRTNIMKQLIETANNNKPAIINIDNIDSLADGYLQNDALHIANKLLFEQIVNEMRNCGEKILIICTTKKPWKIHNIMRQIYEKQIYCPLPDDQLRGQLIKKKCSDFEQPISQIELDDLVQKTKGFSVADINQLYTRADEVAKLQSTSFLFSDKQNAHQLTYQDMVLALKKVKRSVEEDEIIKFEQWNQGWFNSSS